MTNQTFVVDGVDPDATIPIEVPGYMFIRLNQLLLNGIGIKSAEHLYEIGLKLKENKIDRENNIEYHAETILYINALISEQAKKLNKVKPMEIKPSTS